MNVERTSNLFVTIELKRMHHDEEGEANGKEVESTTSSFLGAATYSSNAKEGPTKSNAL